MVITSKRWACSCSTEREIPVFARSRQSPIPSLAIASAQPSLNFSLLTCHLSLLSVTVMPMPFSKELSVKSKVLRIFNSLLLFTFLLSLITLLSGCSAIGTNKPAALQITSVPEAAVFLDGKHLGKTPFYSDQLKAGNYTLKITAADANFLTPVTLRDSTLTVVNRQLANNFMAQSGEILSLEPGKISLILISQPPEATLNIDGKLAGKTPVLVADIAEGDHKLEISRDGYVTREFAVKVLANFQLQANVTLASTTAKDVPASPTPTPIPKIQITQTPQGFLRVRRDASVNSPEIGRVKTGDQFEIIQETTGWVKISFEGKQGWVSAEYTKKL